MILSMYVFHVGMRDNDVDFIRPCGVVVFALFYCHLDLCCGECYVSCLQFECVPIYVSDLCLCMRDMISELLRSRDHLHVVL